MKVTGLSLLRFTSPWMQLPCGPTPPSPTQPSAPVTRAGSGKKPCRSSSKLLTLPALGALGRQAGMCKECRQRAASVVTRDVNRQSRGQCGCCVDGLAQCQAGSPYMQTLASTVLVLSTGCHSDFLPACAPFCNVCQSILCLSV